MTTTKSTKKSKRDMIFQLAVIVLIAGLLAWIIPNSRAAAGQATFSIEPGTSSPVQNATQTYKIYVTPTGANMISAGVTVNIPTQLQFQSFNSTGTNFGIVTTPSGTPAVGATSVAIIAGNFPASPGLAGAKLLIGEITVKPSTVGSYTISLTDLKAKDVTEVVYSPLVAQNAAVTVVPPPAPDLVVTGITTNPATPQPGNNVTFTAIVKNQGNLATTAGVGHVARVNIGTLQYTSASYSTAIAAGASVNIPMTSGQWPATVGTFTITSIADSTNTIVESNETNNQLSSSINVADTQAPTVSPTFPGATETLVGNDITIRSIPLVSVRPNATDNVAVTSTTVTVNGVTKTPDGSGNYLLDNKNGDYVVVITARDAANNAVPRTITVKVRHPDIVRDGAVNFDDFTRMLIQWNTSNPESDLSGNGLVDFDDFTKILLAWTG